MGKDKIGQMFMIGFDGYHVSKDLKKMVLSYGIGGIILFSRNIKGPIHLASLCNDLQSLSPDIPLFISIDQEGGRVSRLKEPFIQLPPVRCFGMMLEKELGEIKKESDNGLESERRKEDIAKLVCDLGRIVAMELRSVGINMNFAPVLDIDTNPENPVIGDRSFGATPHVVSTLGNAFIKGLQGNGVIATGKHFPGHGDTDCDSHEQLPTVKHDVKRMGEVELRPFVEAIEKGVEGIMTAHVLYHAWDNSMPATLSEKILKGLLREDMGFKGLIISDDMDMGAVDKNYPIEETVVNAINAGVDIVLMGNGLKKQEKAVRSAIAAVEKGIIPQSRIEESTIRITEVKNRYLLPYYPVNHDDIKAVFERGERKEVIDRIDRLKLNSA